jgi:hypothetical protein
VAHQAHGRHHTELPRGVPVVVGELAERLDLRRARVVDEDVDRAARGPVDALGRVRGRDVEAVRARDADHPRALALQQVGHRRADAARRAGHDRRASADPEVHSRHDRAAARAARTAEDP